MAAAKKPLEFHAERPWGADGRLEDSDEDDEDDNEAEDGFSMAEVLRLGGTKVVGPDLPEAGAEWGAGSGPARGPGAAGREGVPDPDPDPRFGEGSVRFRRRFFTRKKAKLAC